MGSGEASVALAVGSAAASVINGGGLGGLGGFAQREGDIPVAVRFAETQPRPTGASAADTPVTVSVQQTDIEPDSSDGPEVRHGRMSFTAQMDAVHGNDSERMTALAKAPGDGRLGRWLPWTRARDTGKARFPPPDHKENSFKNIVT